MGFGKDYFDFDDLADFVFEREHKFPGSYLLRALAGLILPFGI